MSDEKKSDVRIRIGERLAALRKAQGMTQQELADRADVLRPNLVRIEKGRVSVGLDTLESIARALGKSVELVNESYTMHPTGMIDKNGIPIHVGDIVRCTAKELPHIELVGFVMYDETDVCYKIKFTIYYLEGDHENHRSNKYYSEEPEPFYQHNQLEILTPEKKTYEYEVIGNRIDNRELLDV